MKRKDPPLWLCIVLLALALCWRAVGAPMTAQQFRELQTPLWQMRVQLPSRAMRVLKLWQSPPEEPAADEPAEADTTDLSFPSRSEESFSASRALP